MKKYMTIALMGIFALLAIDVSAQYKYGLKVTGLEAYRRSVVEDPNKELIDLKKHIPGLVLDIRYATENNFMKERMYNLARAYARKPVADALKKVQSDLAAEGLGIKVFDAYRPYKATVKFYEFYKDTTYVASPYRGSRHNRGCALDITLINLKTGEELKMPTGYDSFSRAAWPGTPMKDPIVAANRKKLIDIMQKYGFRVNGSEWWHYDFIGYKKYEILDIDFEELETP